jgi:ketosteroid isomerase-like protein
MRLIVLAISLIFISSISAAQELTEKAAAQLERDRQDAFIRGDADFIDAQTAEKYSTINAKGQKNGKAQMMANIRARKTQVLSVTLDDLEAHVFGDTAVVTGIYRDTNISNGEKRQTAARFTRVFLREQGKWRAIAYQQTALTK